MLVRANLKIGEAMPQMTLAIIKARMGFIFSYFDKLSILQLFLSSQLGFQ
jgi:hypothetical protein